jgi:hypothetical protein
MRPVSVEPQPGMETPIIHRGTQNARTDTFRYNIGKDNLQCILSLNIEADAIDFSEDDGVDQQDSLNGGGQGGGVTIITSSSKRLYDSSPQLVCQRQGVLENSTVLKPLAFAFDCQRLDRVIQNVLSSGRSNDRAHVVARQKNTPVGTCDIRIGSDLFQPIVRL